MTADMRKVFLQVKVPDEDRYALRLSWRAKSDIGEPLIMYRRTPHPSSALSPLFSTNGMLRETAATHDLPKKWAIFDGATSSVCAEDRLDLFCQGNMN